MNLKRSIVVEGDTPGKSKSKTRATTVSGPRKSLFSEISDESVTKETTRRPSWTKEEVKTLVQQNKHLNNKWPVTKDQTFWKNCAEAVNTNCHSSRTGILY